MASLVGDDFSLGTSVEAAARILARSRSVLFVTGAGLSADSDLPTYRGVGGLYERETEDGLPIEEALSGETFRRRPELTWRILCGIERLCRGAGPNPGHAAIAALQDRLDRCVVLTQNVDGFHGRAGSRDVIEIHGDLKSLRCVSCPWTNRVEDYASLAIPPLCPRCHGLVRPEVVLFGEMLPPRAVARLDAELALGFDAVFSVGTTSAFPYISYPVARGRANGAGTVEVNPGESEVSGLVDVRVRARAAEALPAIVAAARRLGFAKG